MSEPGGGAFQFWGKLDVPALCPWAKGPGACWGNAASPWSLGPGTKGRDVQEIYLWGNAASRDVQEIYLICEKLKPSGRVMASVPPN